MKRAVPYLVAAFTLCAVTFFAKGTASAAPQVLTLTPTSAQIVAKPGGTATGKFQVINPGGEEYAVHLYAAPYTVKTEAYTPDFIPIAGKPNVAAWVHLSTTQGTLSPNQTITVQYHVDVPTGIQPGGYYAVAFAQTQAKAKAGGVVVNERVGEILYIQVSGAVIQSGKLLSWSTPFLQKPPLGSALRLENDGGLHYASDVNVVVSDLFGHAKYTVHTQKEVLPQTIRKISLSWKQAPPLGLFKVSGTASVLGTTQHLPTKYVLVASQTARIVSLIVFSVCLLTLIVWPVFKKHQRRRK